MCALPPAIELQAAADQLHMRVVQGMRKGVKESAAFILFLSAGVLLRPVRAPSAARRRPMSDPLVTHDRWRCSQVLPTGDPRGAGAQEADHAATR